MAEAAKPGSADSAKSPAAEGGSARSDGVTGGAECDGVKGESAAGAGPKACPRRLSDSLTSSHREQIDIPPKISTPLTPSSSSSISSLSIPSLPRVTSGLTSLAALSALASTDSQNLFILSDEGLLADGSEGSPTHTGEGPAQITGGSAHSLGMEQLALDHQGVVAKDTVLANAFFTNGIEKEATVEGEGAGGEGVGGERKRADRSKEEEELLDPTKLVMSEWGCEGVSEFQ